MAQQVDPTNHLSMETESQETAHSSSLLNEEVNLEELFRNSEQTANLHLSKEKINAMRVTNPSKSIRKNQQRALREKLECIYSKDILQASDSDDEEEEQGDQEKPSKKRSRREFEDEHDDDDDEDTNRDTLSSETSLQEEQSSDAEDKEDDDDEQVEIDISDSISQIESLEENDWIMQFTNPDRLKKFLNLIYIIMKDSEVTFKILYNQQFSGLMVECIDPKNIIIVSGRVDARVEIGNGVPIYFTLKLKTLISALKKTSPKSTIYIYKRKSLSSHVQLVVINDNDVTYRRSSSIALIEMDSPHMRLKPIESKFTFHIDPEALKDITENAKDNRADFINFKIIQPVSQKKKRRMGESSQDEVVPTIFRITVRGEQITSQYQYISIAKKSEEGEDEENDQHQSLNDASVPDMNFTRGIVKYDHDFMTKYLHDIVHAIKSNKIKLSFKKGEPLVIHMDFTNVNGQKDNSYMRYVIVSRETIDDDASGTV